MSIIYQIFATTVVGVISFSLSLFIARQIGTINFGQYSTALAIGSILAIGLDGGMRNLLTRERTKVSDHLLNFQSYLPHIAMGYSLTAALLASIICWGFFPNQLYLGLGIVWCFWGSVITQYSSAILRGDGYMKADSLWQLKQRVLTAAFIFTTVLLGYHEAWQLLISWSIGALCANIFLKDGFWYSPAFKPLLLLNPRIYQSLLPFIWINLATTIYFRSDLILLWCFEVSDSDIGQYAAAYRLIEAVILIANPISIFVFRKTRLLYEEYANQRNYIIKSLLFCILFSLIGTILIQLITPSLVYLAYGAQYAETTALVTILGWMILLIIPNLALTQIALALNQEKSYALIATLAAISNISLNFVFIPKYGVIATAYTSIATELIIFIGLILVIFRKMKFNIYP